MAFAARLGDPDGLRVNCKRIPFGLISLSVVISSMFRVLGLLVSEYKRKDSIVMPELSFVPQKSLPDERLIKVLPVLNKFQQQRRFMEGISQQPERNKAFSPLGLVTNRSPPDAIAGQSTY
jgi:hypothetical protein